MKFKSVAHLMGRCQLDQKTSLLLVLEKKILSQTVQEDMNLYRKSALSHYLPSAILQTLSQ